YLKNSDFHVKTINSIATLPVRRLAAMVTLSTIARPRDTDGAAQSSSDSEPSSPTNLQRTKRQRAVHTASE
ncbi:hypothetical protein E4U61_005232, partial [Claviceps capensis]